MTGWWRFSMGAAWGAGLVLALMIAPLALAVTVLQVFGIGLQLVGRSLELPSKHGLRLVTSLIDRLPPRGPKGVPTD